MVLYAPTPDANLDWVPPDLRRRRRLFNRRRGILEEIRVPVPSPRRRRRRLAQSVPSAAPAGDTGDSSHSLVFVHRITLPASKLQQAAKDIAAAYGTGRVDRINSIFS